MDNEPQPDPGQQGAAIVQPQPEEKKHRNAKNKTPLATLQYMRNYRKLQKAAKLAKECGYVKVSDTNVNNTDTTTSNPTKTQGLHTGKVSVKNGFDRNALLREFEGLARSGNDMAAIAALKAYAEFAGIGPESRADGLLTPDQAKGYHKRMLEGLQARLAQGGLVRAQIVTGNESRTFEGSTSDVLASVNSMLQPTTGSVCPDNNKVQDTLLTQDTQPQAITQQANGTGYSLCDVEQHDQQTRIAR